MKPNHNRIRKTSGSLICAVLLGLLLSAATAQKLDMTPLPNTNLAKMNVLLMDSWKSGDHGKSAQIAKAAMENFQKDIGFKMTYSKKQSDMNLNYLKNFNILVFNYTADANRLFNSEQKKAIEDFVKGGGHWIGFHTAAFPRKGQWEWYRTNLIIGSYNPNYHGKRNGKMVKTSDPEIRKHPILSKMPESFTAVDEWYAFNQGPIFDKAKVIYYIDESSMGSHSHKHLDAKQMALPVELRHPISWFYENPESKGRVFFTGIIHDPAGADTDFFKLTILRAMEYCAGYTGAAGCPDPKYQEFNPDRTSDDPGLCKTLKPVSIFKTVGGEPGAALTGYTLSFNKQIPHSIVVHDIAGALVKRITGSGVAVYNLSDMLPLGIYQLQVRVQGESSSHKLFLY